MVSLIALPLLALGASVPRESLPQDVPRIRRVLPNGAFCFIEKVGGQKVVSVNLFLGSKPYPDLQETHGHRHLLEHLVARAIPGQDEALETLGALLIPETTRDYMRFEWFGPTDSLSTCLGFLEKTLRPMTFRQEDVQRESRAIELEADLRTRRDQVSRFGWMNLYSQEGLDSFGTLSVIKEAQAPALEKAWERLLSCDNVVVSIVGDVDIDAVFSQVQTILGKLGRVRPRPEIVRKKASGSSRGSDGLAIPIGPIQTRKSLAKIGLALLVSQQVPRSELSYIPSGYEGALIINTPAGSELFLKKLDEIHSNGQSASVPGFAEAYIREAMNSVSGRANFRGQLHGIERSLTPERLLELTREIRDGDIEEAVKDIREASGVQL